MTHNRSRSTFRRTGRFKRDAQRCVNREGRSGCTKDELLAVQKEIMACEKVPDERKPHPLHGNWSGFWECHIRDDCLIVWKFNDENTVTFVRMGRHEELFT